MAIWIRLTKNHYFGLFALGLALFAIQEMPYIIMPLIPLQSNPLMEMQDKSITLSTIEKTLGVSCIIVMLFWVRGDVKWFSLDTIREKFFFGSAVLAIAGYFAGWVFYFSGFQSLPLIFCSLVAFPPLYYAFIGLWRGNYALTVLGGMFLIAHVSNVWNNLR